MNEDDYLEMAYEDRFIVNDVDDDSDPEALNDFDQRTEIDDDFDNDFNIHS